MSKRELAAAIGILEEALYEMKESYDNLPDYENVEAFPMQPIYVAKDGCVRFKENRLVRALLDHGQATGFGLNELADKFYPHVAGSEYQEDWNQLAQLIGYSISGFGDLSYAYPDVVKQIELLKNYGTRKKNK